MDFDFSNCPDRTNTGSLKWDKYAERDVLPMWVADMDFVSAPAILEALRARIDHGVFGYTVPYAEAEAAVCNYLKREHDYAVEADWLFWMPGLVPALNVAARAFCEPGEAVMTHTPVYPPFLSAPTNQGCELITVPLKEDGDRWRMDFEAMEAAVTPKTRLFLLCHPHNPVGHLWRDDELRRLFEFCERHDLILCSDEIHCDLLLDPNLKHRMTATLGPEFAARTITLMAPSKTYNLPGLACAYAIIENPRLRATFKRAAAGFITEVNALGYAGCAAAYEHGESWRQALLETLRTNRDLVYTAVAERMSAIKLRPMEATYLAWLDVSELGLEDPAAHFEAHGVGLSDGRFFGDKRFLRLNFGCSRERLEEALRRMEKAVSLA